MALPVNFNEEQKRPHAAPAESVYQYMIHRPRFLFLWIEYTRIKYLRMFYPCVIAFYPTRMEYPSVFYPPRYNILICFILPDAMFEPPEQTIWALAFSFLLSQHCKLFHNWHLSFSLHMFIHYDVTHTLDMMLYYILITLATGVCMHRS